MQFNYTKKIFFIPNMQYFGVCVLLCVCVVVNVCACVSEFACALLWQINTKGIRAEVDCGSV